MPVELETPAATGYPDDSEGSRPSRRRAARASAARHARGGVSVALPVGGGAGRHRRERAVGPPRHAAASAPQPLRPVALGVAAAVAATGGIAAAAPASTAAAGGLGAGSDLLRAAAAQTAPGLTAARNLRTSASVERTALSEDASRDGGERTSRAKSDRGGKAPRDRADRATGAERGSVDKSEADADDAVQGAPAAGAVGPAGAAAVPALPAAPGAAEQVEAALGAAATRIAEAGVGDDDGGDDDEDVVADASEDLLEAVSGALPASVDELTEAARARAQQLLADRVQAIEKAAAEAAADAGPPKLRASCGYRASAQKTPGLDRAQKRNARTIIDVAKEMDLPPRAAVVALATAYQESWLKNLNWGDRDSLGLFQQRPSMGWGSPSELRTPEYAARAFYAALKEVDGWQHMPATVAAQTVQRSAFPDRYAQWELMAAELVDEATEVSDAALNCRR